MFIYAVLLLFAIVCDVFSKQSTCLRDKEKTSLYLQGASNLISKALYKMPSCKVQETSEGNCSQKPKDCADVLSMGNGISGVYTIWPVNRLTGSRGLEVYCDMETDGGGWTVIQRRGAYGNPQDYFYNDWDEYKKGFGDLQKEFWLGNDNIFALTNQKLYSIRIDMQGMNFDEKYATYDSFWIDDENNDYTLHISGFNGNAGDSLSYHDNRKFSTKDRRNDIHKRENCAQSYKGAWWYGACHHSNLNGLYIEGRERVNSYGIHWTSWKGYFQSLKRAEMKIRPKESLL